MKKKKEEKKHTFLGVIFLSIILVLLIYYIGTVFNLSYVKYFTTTIKNTKALWNRFLNTTMLGMWLNTYSFQIQVVLYFVIGTFGILWTVISFFAKQKYRIWIRPFVILSFLFCIFLVIILVFTFPAIAKFPLFTFANDLIRNIYITTGIMWGRFLNNFAPQWYEGITAFLYKTQYLIANIGTFYFIWMLLFKFSNYFRERQNTGTLDKRNIQVEENSPLYSAFNEVYVKACTLDKSVPKSIKLFINESPAINAMAYGKNHLCVNRGAIEKTDIETVKAMMAHEIGHLAHKDTIALQISAVCINFLLFGLLVPLNITGIIVTSSCAIIPAIGNILSGFFGNLLQDKCQDMFRFLFSRTQILARIVGGRKDEMRADAFAARCGYGEQLINLFAMHPDSGGGFDEHPKNAKRIENIRRIMQQSNQFKKKPFPTEQRKG